MDIQKFESYLKIKHSYYSTPSLEALNYYVRRFMITVPFENINNYTWYKSKNFTKNGFDCFHNYLLPTKGKRFHYRSKK